MNSTSNTPTESSSNGSLPAVDVIANLPKLDLTNTSRPRSLSSPALLIRDSIDYLSGKAASRFNDKACKFMRKTLQGKQIFDINEDNITARVQTICRILAENFQTPQTVQSLIERVQTRGVILSPIIQRIEFLQSSLSELIKAKQKQTLWTKEFQKKLTRIILTQNHLPSFLKEVGAIQTKICNSLILTPKTFEVLKMWESPPESIISSLKDNLSLISRVRNLSAIKHLWFEPENPDHPISLISCSSIIRSLATSEGVLMHLVTINGNEFYNAETTDSPLSQIDFLEMLIQALCNAGIKPNVSNEEISSQVFHLLASAKLEPEIEQKYIKKNLLPFLETLRPATMDTWGHADELIRKTFPALFMNPYWTKLGRGTECHFMVRTSKDFEVRVCKKYAVYHRLKSESNSSIPLVEGTKPLCQVQFQWTLKPNGSGWKGTLCISDSLKWSADITEEEKWVILHSLSCSKINATSARPFVTLGV